MRNLSAEKEVYLRMYRRLSLADREYTERHFEAVRTQDPQGCDTGRKVPAVFPDEEGME